MLHLSSAVLQSHRQLGSTSSGTGSYTTSPLSTAQVHLLLQVLQYVGSGLITSTFLFWEGKAEISFHYPVCLRLGLHCVGSRCPSLAWVPKRFNGGSKKWCLCQPPADGPHPTAGWTTVPSGVRVATKSAAVSKDEESSWASSSLAFKGSL